MTEHILKTLPDYYDAVDRGDKNFEVRRDDRGFQKGDVVVLQRLVKSVSGKYGVECVAGQAVQTKREISYILTGGQFGIEAGYVVLGLK